MGSGPPAVGRVLGGGMGVGVRFRPPAASMPCPPCRAHRPAGALPSPALHRPLPRVGTAGGAEIVDPGAPYAVSPCAPLIPLYITALIGHYHMAMTTYPCNTSRACPHSMRLAV